MGAAGRLRRLLKHDQRLRQESKVVHYQEMGDIGLVLAGTKLWHVLPGESRSDDDAQKSQKYLAFRILAGKPRVVCPR